MFSPYAVAGFCVAAVLPSVCLADLDFAVAGRPYKLVTTPRTWAAAQEDAILLGGHLVHVDSAEENAQIQAAIQATVPAASVAPDAGGAQAIWLGGKEAAEGNYEWTDAPGTPFWAAGAAVAGAHQNWAPSEPDNLSGTQDRVAMTMPGQSGAWYDVSSTNTLAYVVELSGLYVSLRMSHGGVDQGTLCAKLYPDKAPMAVANFISLAEGKRAFIDRASGLVAQRPFYTGLTWHRVIPGFMCQGGDPAGNGSSGPGYTFPDKFDATVRHSRTGLLSMANSGPHTNGSQFFITVANTPWLDDKHTIFGEVVSGYSTVVVPLSNVPTSATRPVLPVVMESVQIHRAGIAARAFDAMAHGLPLLREVQAQSARDPANGHCLLQWPGEPQSAYSVLQTTNFTTWSNFSEEVLPNITLPAAQSLDTVSLFASPTPPSRSFFRIVESRFAAPFVSPLSLQGQQVTAIMGNTTFVFKLTGATTGSWQLISPLLNGSIVDYVYERASYGGRLRCAVNGLSVGGSLVRIMDLPMLHQTTATGGANLYLEGNGGSVLAKLVNGTFSTVPVP